MVNLFSFKHLFPTLQNGVSEKSGANKRSKSAWKMFQIEIKGMAGINKCWVEFLSRLIIKISRPFLNLT